VKIATASSNDRSSLEENKCHRQATTEMNFRRREDKYAEQQSMRFIEAVLIDTQSGSAQTTACFRINNKRRA
jgi:hypothetical protein